MPDATERGSCGQARRRTAPLRFAQILTLRRAFSAISPGGRHVQLGRARRYNPDAVMPRRHGAAAIDLLCTLLLRLSKIVEARQDAARRQRNGTRPNGPRSNPVAFASGSLPCRYSWTRRAPRTKISAHKGPGRFAMYRLTGAVAVVVGLTTHAVAQAPLPPFYSPVPPCPSATSPFDTNPAEARWDYVCPQNLSCSFQFSGITGRDIGSVLAASIFVLKAGPQNRAFAASVTNQEGTTHFYTEDPLDFKWSVRNMTLQCRSQS